MPSILTRPSGGGAAFSATVAVSVDNSTPDIGDTIQGLLQCIEDI